jgi:aromatic ring-opening dioxygenase catalytic subunit (LigB family)
MMAAFARTAMSAVPVLFLSHGAGPAALLNFKGSPLQELDSTSPSAAFLRNLQDVVTEVYPVQNIKSILVVSAHWEESSFTVDHQTGPTTLLYDYYGFPAESYAPHLTYPVPTDTKLAEKVHQVLTDSGIQNSLRRREGGFDHGVFIPLKLAFPKADIPVVQVSLRSDLDMAAHIRLGEALAPLRNEGVLIIGSGQITHSDGSKHRLPPGEIDPRCIEFTNWIKDLLEGTNEHNYEERKQTLIDAPKLAPHFTWQHPRPEHFIPLAVAFGASKPTPTGSCAATDTEGTCPAGTGSLSVKRLFHHVAMGRMATDSYIFTSAK